MEPSASARSDGPPRGKARSRAWLACARRTFLAIVAFAASSCGGLTQSAGPSAIAIMPGVINRTDNKSLRFAMLKYGLDSFCQEITTRGAPLRLRDDQPSIGRFFPQRCDARV